MRDVTTAGPVPGVAMGSYKVKYKTYPVSEVKCVDGKGQPHVMYMLPSIEMHITEVDGKKTVFYLDMTKVSNDTLYGTKSRMLGFLKASIPMNRIKKIKVVNNHMSFHYTDY